jgi:hypothetical protein
MEMASSKFYWVDETIYGLYKGEGCEVKDGQDGEKERLIVRSSFNAII